MSRGSPAHVEDAVLPFVGHPFPEEVGHGAYKNCRWGFHLPGICETVRVEHRLESLRPCLRSLEPLCYLPGIAVRAAVLAAGDRVPGMRAPLYGGLIHTRSSPIMTAG